jgi:hypothetical protein
MADFYTTEQLVFSLGITEPEITDLVEQRLLLPVTKNGRQFHPARQVYRLRVAIRLAHKQKVTLAEAMTQVSERSLYHVERALR